MKLIEPTYDVAPATAVDQPTATGVSLVWGKELAWLVCVLAIVAIGIWLRITPSAGFTGTGFDEALYRNYIVQLERVGLSGYPAICEHYIRDQRKPETITKLPPTRFLYIFSGWVWKRVAFGDAPPAPITAPNLAQIDPALISLHRVSAFFSILMLVLTAAWAPRLCGKMNGMAVMALMAFAPLQIHMAQHALIDGFFAFWATLSLWMLWENLQRPNNAVRSSALAISLAMMVLTKENAFFVYVGFWGLLGLNRWVPFGIITRKLLLVMIIGPLAGLVILITLAGGADTFIDIYRLLVSKAQNLTYAIKTGDGPWHRYLVDIMLVSPIVLCLALGGVVTAVRENRAALYLTAFVVFSYLVMCNVRYGMNLRYATIWDLPIRVLAVSQLALIAGFFGNRRVLAFAVGIAALCAYELKQYVTFFKDFGLYELVSEGLLRAVKILK